MKISERLRLAQRVFFDTAPIIYLVEKNPRYFPTMKAVADLHETGAITVVTSPITLAECLVTPYRTNHVLLQRRFVDVIMSGENTVFEVIDGDMAVDAARLRAQYSMRLADAFQIAVALRAGCDAFLTNDGVFKRITALDVITLDDVEAG